MKIALLIPWFLPNRGGAEIGAWEMGRRLVKRGHEVLIITPRYRLEWPEAEEMEGLRIERYISLAPSGLRRLSEVAHSLQAVPGVFHRLNRFQPDLVHLHYLFFTGYPGMLWSVKNHRPTMVTLVGNDIYDPYYIPCSFLSPLNRWLLGHADRIVAASTFVRRVLESKYRVPASKLSVIPYGVDVHRFRPVSQAEIQRLRLQLNLPTSRTIILTVQRLHERKGVAYYLDTIAKALSARPDLYFVIVGGGPQKKLLEKKAQALGIASHVCFTGRVSDEDLPLYYQTCDLFAFHTLHEGFGIVLLEAMASGKPVITTRAGGTLDIMTDDTGTMVEPRDSGAFADLMLGTLARPEHMLALGHANRARVEAYFNWETITTAYGKQYDALRENVKSDSSVLSSRALSRS